MHHFAQLCCMDAFPVILIGLWSVIESIRDDEPIRASNLLPCEITLEAALVQLTLFAFCHWNTDVFTERRVGLEGLICFDFVLKNRYIYHIFPPLNIKNYHPIYGMACDFSIVLRGNHVHLLGSFVTKL